MVCGRRGAKTIYSPLCILVMLLLSPIHKLTASGDLSARGIEKYIAMYKKYNVPNAALHHGISLGMSALIDSNSEGSPFGSSSKNRAVYILPFCD
jgi:hypothetical protein